jgi:hypothetical protein
MNDTKVDTPPDLKHICEYYMRDIRQGGIKYEPESIDLLGDIKCKFRNQYCNAKECALYIEKIRIPKKCISNYDDDKGYTVHVGIQGNMNPQPASFKFKLDNSGKKHIEFLGTDKDRTIMNVPLNLFDLTLVITNKGERVQYVNVNKIQVVLRAYLIPENNRSFWDRFSKFCEDSSGKEKINRKKAK